MDGFRALSILWVFLLHAWLKAGRPPVDGGILRSLVAEGYLGLDVLFILSGFVLFLPVALNGGSIGSIRSYGLRRAARIMPAYYLTLVLVLAFHRWITPEAVVLQPWTSLPGFEDLVKHLLFLQTYIGTLGFGVLPVVWTLTLEATFYVVLPFVARMFHRRPVVWLAGALVAAELWQRAISPAGGLTPTTVPSLLGIRLVLSFPTYVGHFALGMAAACLFVRIQHAASTRPWRLALPVVQLGTGTALVAFMLHRAAASAVTQYYLVERLNSGFVAILMAAFMLATALAPRWAQVPFANRLCAGVGDTSYGVYLVHYLLLCAAATVLGVRADGSNEVYAQLVFFTLPPALALGWLSCRFLEQPTREWARRRLKRPRSHGGPPAALGWHEGPRGNDQHDRHERHIGHDGHEARAG
jgi:peptidoglycan/LPS O-acetylase OafA/YrhL